MKGMDHQNSIHKKPDELITFAEPILMVEYNDILRFYHLCGYRIPEQWSSIKHYLHIATINAKDPK